jgi:hypothetical protein
MDGSNKTEKACRVTITIPKILLDQLKQELALSEIRSLSGLIASKIIQANMCLPDSRRHLTIVTELKPGKGFPDVLSQLQVMTDSLRVTKISGHLDFDGSGNDTVETVIMPSTEPVGPKSVDVNEILLETLELPERTRDALKGANIKTVGQLRTKTASELIRIRNFGRLSLRSCQAKLLELGIEVTWTESWIK